MRAGVDAVMDLSTGDDLDLILDEIIKHSPVMVGTVPIYKSVSKMFSEGKTCPEISADDIFKEIETHAKAGVDFITVHCGITRHTVSVLESCGRLMGIVSRGGSLLVEWIRKKYDMAVLSEEPEEELLSIESTEYWKEMEKNRVGNLLAGARLKAGLTQTQLAKKLDIRQNMVSDYECGRRTYSDAMAKKLSKTLKVKEEHLKYRSKPSS